MLIPLNVKNNICSLVWSVSYQKHTSNVSIRLKKRKLTSNWISIPLKKRFIPCLFHSLANLGENQGTVEMTLFQASLDTLTNVLETTSFLCFIIDFKRAAIEGATQFGTLMGGGVGIAYFNLAIPGRNTPE